jgi:hypothetical protein
MLLRVIYCCCLLSVVPVKRPASYIPPVIRVTFTPDRRPENPDSDTIFYRPARKLSWADFKAVPPLRGPSAAVSYSSFAYEGSSLHKRDTLVLNLTLQAFFIKSASWAKPIAKDSYGLAHEQLHFDITWLVALRFQQRIKTMQLTIEDYDSIIQYEYIESFREMNRLQKAYDDESNHGMSAMAQDRWQRIIAEAITAITVEGALTTSDTFISSLQHF